jgi:1,4-alpha-glucan branching enzyme
MTMRFVLTLHSHLPWVLHHGRWPHGSDWLAEATLDTYLPLLAMLEGAARDDLPIRITLGITPVLAAQLADPAYRDEIDDYFGHRLVALDRAPDALELAGDTELLPLVPFWREHLQALQSLWTRLGGDLIAAFRGHAEAGRIELISSAATHGLLPLLARDESIRLQLLVGRSEHLRHFGALPRGCWLPECAYRPRGPWNPWPGAPAAPLRRGIEEHMRHAGFQWWFVDAHLAEAGEAFEVYEQRTTRRTPTDDIRSPYRGYEVGSRPTPLARPVQVLVRDPETTARVWSRHGGYPGDGRYLEFHKLHHPDGIRFWRVTDPDVDLGQKAPYDPARARDALAQHARHFRGVLESIAAGAAPGDTAIVAPFDTELFGHWWFEGVDWLADLHRELATTGEVTPATAGEVLTETPPTTSIRMRSGSWGANGDFSKWLNDETAWTWHRLWALEERFWNAVPAALDHAVLEPVLEQAARELLLAQSSDWQFIISTGAAGDYATKRFVEHCEALESLLPALELGFGDLDGAVAAARALQRVDGPFPSLLGAIAAASDVTEP